MTTLSSANVFESTTFSFSDNAPEPPERRISRRHLTILRVAKIISGRSQDLCLIRNISAGGLMAHVYSTLMIGERVAIELKDDQRLFGAVRWVQDANVGIEFDAKINVGEVLANQIDGGAVGKPRPPRIDRSCRARLRIGANFHQVIVHDVSQGGVKVEIAPVVAAGDPVVVTMEGFRPVPGVIRWVRDGHAGVSFNEVISYGELTRWLQEAFR